MTILLVIGIYCILATTNLIRALIGLEVLIKAVTLLIIVSGYLSKHIALAQSLVITLIVIEVVVMTVAAGIISVIHRHNNSLELKDMRNPKGKIK
ncbi:MAG: NADH-quinone oxidoreductase subunit K [Candidatus Omnitrophota bacterium]